MSADEFRAKATELRHELDTVLERFVIANSELPAQVVMAGLGEMMVQFALSQVGPQMTREFLDQLKEAVQLAMPRQH